MADKPSKTRAVVTASKWPTAKAIASIEIKINIACATNHNPFAVMWFLFFILSFHKIINFLELNYTKIQIMSTVEY